MLGDILIGTVEPTGVEHVAVAMYWVVDVGKITEARERRNPSNTIEFKVNRIGQWRIQTFGYRWPHPFADPDIRLPRPGGSRHSATRGHIIWRIQVFGYWRPHHLAEPDIRLTGATSFDGSRHSAGGFNIFPSIPCLYLRWRRG